ncbi:3-isopropylmalate dehydratase small subunit [Trichinella pseudospiralis]
MNRTQMLKTLKFEVFWTENQEQLNQSKDVLAEAECGAKVVVCGRVFGATKQTPILHRYMMLALTRSKMRVALRNCCSQLLLVLQCKESLG